MTEHQPILYEPDQRPDVEVLVDDTWWPGEVRMVSFTADPDGQVTTLHNVQYRTDAGQFVETLPDDRVRGDTTDRSHGRAPAVGGSA